MKVLELRGPSIGVTCIACRSRLLVEFDDMRHRPVRPCAEADTVDFFGADCIVCGNWLDVTDEVSPYLQQAIMQRKGTG